MMLLVIWSVAILAALSLYLRQVFSKFNKHGVKNLRPLPFLGNMGWIILRREHLTEATTKLCRTFPEERFLGWFEFLKPMIILRDIELIKKIGVKDFEHFLDHRTIIDTKLDPIFGRTLLSLQGQEWKDMRSTLSPAFTSSKIRLMVPFMVEVGDIMIKSLKSKIDSSEDDGYVDIECRDLTTRYANDVIASCAFGLKVDSHTDRDNKFYNMGKIAASFDFKQLLILIIMAIVPTVSKILKISMFSEATKDFFRDLVLNTMKEREVKQIVRPDMIHLLMEAKKGKLTQEESGTDTDAGFATVEESTVGKKDVSRVWTEDDLVAQAVLFLFAGFETVSTAMMFALHELALNPDVQDRLLEEIKEHDMKNGGRLDYNLIQKMNYLDMVVSEVLRKWPPAVGVDRLCLMDYNLGKPNKEVTQDYIIRKGETVAIPVWAIHRDPDYYPEPDKFDPDRFSEQNKHLIKAFTYLPFGLGPRNCIGSRFALCEVKVLLYQLLLHVHVSPCPRTCISAEIARDSFNLRLEGGHWLRFKLRE